MKNSELELRNNQDAVVGTIDSVGAAQFEGITVNSLRVKDKYLNTKIVGAGENFEKNGISSPAIETVTESAGVGYIPEGSPEVIVYNTTIKEGSLIYLTSINPSPSENLTVVKKESCNEQSGQQAIESTSQCKPYFKVALDKTVPTPVHFNWLIIN
jgi:hypothetical protein